TAGNVHCRAGALSRASAGRSVANRRHASRARARFSGSGAAARCHRRRKKPPEVIPPAASVKTVLRDLEVEARAEAPRTRRLDLSDLATGAADGAVLPEQRLALENRALVRRIEEVRRKRHADAVEETEVLRRAEVQLVDVAEARRANRVGDDVDTATREAPRT